MSATPSLTPKPKVVTAYRLDWSFENLTPEDRAAAEKKSGGDTAIVYARRERVQAYEQVDRWLDDVPGSDVVVSLEEIPLDEWVGSFGGDPSEVDA